MRLSTRVAAAAVAAGLTVTGCAASRNDVAGPLTVSALSFAAQLHPADSCDALLSHLQAEAAARVGPYGFGGGPIMYATGASGAPVTTAASRSVMALNSAQASTAAPAIDDKANASGTEAYSTTNVQEVGIDEPDLVKTDGKRILVIANGVFHVVDISGATPKIVGSITLSQGTFQANEILVAGNRVLVFGTGYNGRGGPVPMIGTKGIAAPIPTDSTPPEFQQTATITSLDISDQTNPVIDRRLQVEGDYLAARQIGSTARVVVRSYAQQLPFVYPQNSTGEANAKTFNQQVVRDSKLSDWLPSYELDDANGKRLDKGMLAGCTHVDIPTEFAGFGALSVLTIDMTKPLGNGDAVSILSDGQTVYASDKNLYVATTSYVDPSEQNKPVTNYSTSIHDFDISGTDPAKYVASGNVSGHLLNDYALSEYDGYLRAATTDGAPWAAGTESSITVLKRNGDTLDEVGHVGGMGKGERIYAVRYVGPTAYVVTFRQTDPFYTIDLSKPTAPAVVGELKITGYSGYLHPIGDHLVLGIGQDASSAGRVSGTKATLFDVSDLANPKALSSWTLPGSNSAAEFDPHAFLYWDDKKIAVLPINSYGGVMMPATATNGVASMPIRQPQFNGAVVLSVDPVKGITEVGRITHSSTPDGNAAIMRSLVAADRIWTVSYQHLQANSFTDLSVTAALPL